jgi:hypothetical protein
MILNKSQIKSITSVVCEIDLENIYKELNVLYQMIQIRSIYSNYVI